MTGDAPIAAGKRVLVVEDEPMIRLLLDDMLTDLGYTMAAEAGRLEEALTVAKQGEFDVAILDVNLNGQPISPVADVLTARGVPFVFVSGYARRGIPEEHSTIPLLQKPFQADGLARALAAIGQKPAN
ncbi:MAG: response regulator [Xanthobacteraceae bacterium]